MHWPNWTQIWNRLRGASERGAPSLANSSPSSGQPDLSSVESIRAHGWWQGSVVEAAVIEQQHAGLGNHPYWVVASQTCNLYNPSFEGVPSIELIGASVIGDGEFQGLLANGSRPRVLHSRCHDDDTGRINLELRIQDRVWIRRRLLAKISPSNYRIRDLDNDPAGRWKETFSAWLGRSYTRVELPDAFNKALSNSKLAEFLSKRIAKLSSKVQGVYFEIQSALADEDEELTPDQVARLDPPYRLEITVVVFDAVNQEELERELAKLKEKNIPAEAKAGSVNGEKVSRLDVARAHGIDVRMTEVVTARGWTVNDLMRTVRYTEFDHLSSLDEIAD